MGRIFLAILIFVLLSSQAYSAELPSEIKSILKKKYPKLIFKIDNSFLIGDDTFLPLIPTEKKMIKKFEIIYTVQDKDVPKLIWFTGNYIFVRLLKQPDGQQSILNIDEIKKEYRENFFKTQFPNDLVVPKNLILKKELAKLAHDLPIKISDLGVENLKGTLYLTSPDTGKIVYLDLSDLSMISYIQSMGTPWEIALDKTNKQIFVTDFSKDQIYKLKFLENSIAKNYELPSMSNPIDIELSQDGSITYLIESSANDFVAYETNEDNEFKQLVKTKLPTNPSNFCFLNKSGLVAITFPSLNNIVFLNKNDFGISNQIMVEAAPEKIITNSQETNLYVTNRNSDSISIIDINSKKIKMIQVGKTPTAIALDPQERWLYVANGRSNDISTIDLETLKLINTITLSSKSQFPSDIKITSDGKYLISTSETTNVISIIDLTLRKVVQEIDVHATTHAAYLIEDWGLGIKD